MSVAVEPRPPELPVAPVTDHRRRREVAVVAIPTALALALCLYDLTARNLWLDEAASITIALQHGSAFGSALAHDGGNMLGFYGLLNLFG